MMWCLGLNRHKVSPSACTWSPSHLYWRRNSMPKRWNLGKSKGRSSTALLQAIRASAAATMWMEACPGLACRISLASSRHQALRPGLQVTTLRCFGFELGRLSLRLDHAHSQSSDGVDWPLPGVVLAQSAIQSCQASCNIAFSEDPFPSQRLPQHVCRTNQRRCQVPPGASSPPG